MQHVLAWLERLRGEGARLVVELGANPYYLTLLLRRHFDFELRLANYFGDPAMNGERDHTVQGDGLPPELFRFSHFNVELDPFPWPDASADVVVFCEIVEHLLLDADHVVAEIARVLRPGGHVIVTTPNAARLGNLLRLLRGQSVHDGYSPHGIYGRHNREYTLPEVRDLLRRHGFRIVEERVEDIYSHPLRARLVHALRPTVWKDHLLVLGRKPNDSG